MGSTEKGLIVAVCVSERKGTVKQPVGEIELVPGFGVRGDAHGGSKRQLSLLAEESIDRAREWGIDVTAGSFAENITTMGIRLHELKPGTQLALGMSLVRITQIGKECHTDCEIKQVSGKCIMPTEGVFAAVEMGGVVRAGDEIEIIRISPQKNSS